MLVHDFQNPIPLSVLREGRMFCFPNGGIYYQITAIDPRRDDVYYRPIDGGEEFSVSGAKAQITNVCIVYDDRT